MRLRGGYLDYQTIIDRNAYANSEDVQFMNAALDNNLLVPLKIGFGATLFVDPADWLGLIIGTSDAENEIRECRLGHRVRCDDRRPDGVRRGEPSRPSCRSARGRAAGQLPRGDSTTTRASRSVFGEMGTHDWERSALWLSFDQMVYREREDDQQGLGLFYRYGYREEESYATSQLHSAGLECRGLLPRRDADAFGVGFYRLVSSDDFRAQVHLDFGDETGFEAYYRIQVAPWFAITPDVQYVRYPGGLDSNRDALAFVLRARIRF